VAHFHAAGFAAALIATLDLKGGGVGAQVAMACVPTGLLTVFVGFVTSRWVGVAGTVVLTIGLWLIAWTTLRQRRTARDPLTRTLLAVTAAVPPVTMVLALDWALGRATGLPHLSLTWMAATHGLANLLGFAVCGLLAWRRLSTEDIAVEEDRGAVALRGGRRDRV
jgi:type IV secretory pathway TrbD component